MNKSLVSVGLVVLVLLAGFLLLNQSADGATDYKNATYLINGVPVTLQGGVSEVKPVPDSEVVIKTQYFGNELKADVDGDGREDVVFLLTQETGGSGTFFYAVAALDTRGGYVGSSGYLLGDRIAPQTTNLSQNPAHERVVVVNYAERAAGEPMTTPPSVAQSVYLKLDPVSMELVPVEPDFAGETL